MRTLFDELEPPPVAAAPTASDRPIPAAGTLRAFQEDALTGIGARRKEGSRKILLVMPTGCGKTVVFAHAIHRFVPPKVRTLVLAHRIELVEQAANVIRRVTRRECHIECGEQWAHRHGAGDVVVATVQSLTSGKVHAGPRMSRFDGFGLVIVDEAHHATANTYRKVAAQFVTDKTDTWMLGVTATPDRRDKIGLINVFDSVAYEYEIEDAIDDGWLVPIRQIMIPGVVVDYSGVKTSTNKQTGEKDLNEKQLAAILEAPEIVQGFAKAAFEVAGDRKALLFAVSVQQSKELARVLNLLRAGSARHVDGKTDDEERKRIFSDYGRGTFQFLTNCGIATEGWDDPSRDRPIGVVVMCRPTKSRSLYAQMAGRGTRPVPGLVDPLPTDVARRQAIESSIKPFLEIVDFVGNSGKHKLVTAADLLGGRKLPEIVERAKAKVQASGGAMDVQKALGDAEQDALREEREKQAQAIAQSFRVRYTAKAINPFDWLEVRPARENVFDRRRPITDRMARMLKAFDIDTSRMSYTHALQLCREISKKDLCYPKQAALLKRAGLDPMQIGFKRASRAIGILQKNGWRVPADFQQRLVGDQPPRPDNNPRNRWADDY